jgi:multisubunit Na+/H+ antiporter MnhC subunit/peroxiredoxin
MIYVAGGVAGWLLLIGLWGIVTSRHLVHLCLCLTVVQASTYILLLGIGYRPNATAPVFAGLPVGSPAVDPVVQALMLTDIVVEATVVALLLAVTAACSASPPAQTGSSEPPASHVEVDTPALRQAKRAAGVADCAPGDAAGPAAHDPLPPVTLPCLGGGPDVRLDRLRGPLVINLFAQWCGPCREELPYYEQLHAKGKGRVRVVGIDYLDPQPARALELVRATGVTYPLLADPSGALRADFRIRGLPGLVLVDRDGSVVDVRFEVMRSYAELRGIVSRGLDVRLPG